MQEDITYDLAIVGGGLAGLALSIQIARDGYKVILFEKEQYPFHRVCGEYISNESRAFLESLGLDLTLLGVSQIKKLLVSSVNGRSFQQELPLGGFGISRYKLDHTLAEIAKRSGVIVYQQVRVNNVQFTGEEFAIESAAGNFKSKLAVGSFGKRSNLDVKWKRPFIRDKKNKLNNYIGVKYHIRYNFPDDLIALHNFKKGYCGISKVEDGLYCLCYLTTADNLQECGNDIAKMEETVLFANPWLKKIFSEGKRIRQEPVIISQISFDKKSLIEDHALMIGDAAGMITPLCGNGMSMALHASKIATGVIRDFLSGRNLRKQMEQTYVEQWNRHFAGRLKMGRVLQRLMLNNPLINLMIAMAKTFPQLMKLLIRQTHGDPF